MWLTLLLHCWNKKTRTKVFQKNKTKGFNKIRIIRMGRHNPWSKGRYLYQYVSLIPFILSDNQLFELYHLFLEVNCIMYEMRLFMAKTFPLFKLIRLRCSKYHFKSLVWPRLEPKTFTSRSRCANTQPNLIGTF